jgi:LacI family transcriptional regulator
MSVTIRDIAKKLGLSPAAVSMVMNNRQGIGEETRINILSAARELGYERRKRLPHNRLESLSLVIYGKRGDIVSFTPFFAELTQGIEMQVRKNGWNLIVSYYYESQDHAEQIDAIEASSCRGIILLATEMNAGDLPRFSSLSVPIVLLDNTFDDAGLDSITINNRQGSMQAVKYLEKLGHSNIGHLRSSAQINNCAERRDGYLKSIMDTSALKHTVSVSPTAERAYQDMRKYLVSKPKIPSAFFADNDIIAISCMRALQEAGCRIPRDVSVIGFDDIPACEIADPPLTSMRVPKKTMGSLAVEQLFKRINGDTSENIRIEVNTTLALRSSTAPYGGP